MALLILTKSKDLEPIHQILILMTTALTIMKKYGNIKSVKHIVVNLCPTYMQLQTLTAKNITTQKTNHRDPILYSLTSMATVYMQL